MMSDNDDAKWTCGHCKKTYCKTYRYKTHLKRCLIHNENSNIQNELFAEMLFELKDELKQNLTQEILNMINDIKTDIKQNVKPSKLF
jgi:uncharacterized protein YeeX (DUF496 family)